MPTRVVELLPRRACPGDVTVLLELLDDDEITLSCGDVVQPGDEPV